MKVKSNAEIYEFLVEVLKNANEEVKISEVEFKQGKSPSLTVYIERENGVIDLNDCERVHNLINEPLDELDPTYDKEYTLNVSSLGIDRPFKTEADYEANIGKGVEVKLYSKIEGKKLIEGKLLWHNAEYVQIEMQNGKKLQIDRKNIIKINKQIIFE